MFIPPAVLRASFDRIRELSGRSLAVEISGPIEGQFQVTSLGARCGASSSVIITQKCKLDCPVCANDSNLKPGPEKLAVEPHATGQLAGGLVRRLGKHPSEDGPPLPIYVRIGMTDVLRDGVVEEAAKFMAGFSAGCQGEGEIAQPHFSVFGVLSMERIEHDLAMFQTLADTGLPVSLFFTHNLSQAQNEPDYRLAVMKFKERFKNRITDGHAYLSNGFYFSEKLLRRFSVDELRRLVASVSPARVNVNSALPTLTASAEGITGSCHTGVISPMLGFNLLDGSVSAQGIKFSTLGNGATVEALAERFEAMLNDPHKVARLLFDPYAFALEQGLQYDSILELDRKFGPSIISPVAKSPELLIKLPH